MKKHLTINNRIAQLDSPCILMPSKEWWLGPGLGFDILNGPQLQQIDFLLYQLGYPNGREAQAENGELGLIVRNGKYCRLRPEPLPYISALMIQRPWVQLPTLTNGDGPAPGLFMLSMARARYIDHSLAYVVWRWSGELKLLVVVGQHLYSYPIVEIEAAKHYNAEISA